ncbi:MAG: response regulator, partial [Gammaproteobacteria bacterium]|nr:response regulator [Gammaproteobacteria bacterium]
MAIHQQILTNDSDFLFSNQIESGHNQEPPELDTNQPGWKLMVIDDDEAVHQVTRMVLEDFKFENQGLSIIHGYSAEDAKRLLAEHPDTAILMLDVVMETDHAGLELIPRIRKEPDLKRMRIVLRTGQPGQAPERQVIADYEINDYLEKSNMSADKLQTTIITALRNYKDLLTIESLALSQSNLEQQIEERTREIVQINQSLSKEVNNAKVPIRSY